MTFPLCFGLLSIFGSLHGFQDTTPAGRVLNRFADDVNVMDLSIGRGLIITVTAVLSLIGALVST